MKQEQEHPAYVCRCEEITKEEILEAIRKGDRTVDAVKKRTRAGMGYCQGKGCRMHVASLIAKMIGCSLEECLKSNDRFPCGSVSLKNLADVELKEDEK